MIRIIFCDLDDTLLQPKTKELSDQDRDAVIHWIETGHLFVLATARHHTFLKQVTSQLEQYDFDCVGWNGAEIYMNRKVIRQYPFSQQSLYCLIKELEEYSDFLKVTNLNNEMLLRNYDVYKDILLSDDIVLSMSLKDYLNANANLPITHINYVFDSFEKTNEFYQKYIQSETIQYYQLNCKRTSMTSYDITAHQATKERGIQTYAELKKVPLSQIAVIGDSLNDIGMMRLTSHSFCMNHGDVKAKENASYIVNSVEEAITYLLEKEKTSG